MTTERSHHPNHSDHAETGGTSAEVDTAGTGQDDPDTTAATARAKAGVIAHTTALGRAALQRILRGRRR
jgi:hypothetical protein